MATCPECRKQFPEDVADCPEHGIALLPEAIFTNEDTELEPKTRVGDYEVESKLGEGSFGRVYRAVHPVIGRRVAIKVLNRALSTDPHVVSRFVAEARAIVDVDSPHIVDIYSFGALQDGRQYYVMQLLDGMSLESYLQSQGALEVPVALRILAGMADALCAAHAADVVHRDLKPDNVFIAFDKKGEPVPKLLDFGVAKLLGDRKLGHRTSTGALLGTPAYMAPEQAVGMDVDRRADIYAFGIVAFEMLTAKLPFEADSVVELVRMHTSTPPPALSVVRPGLGKAFDEALGRILAKDPEERPATIELAFGELLDAARQAGHAVTLPPILSLRPPSTEPSGPKEAKISWDAATVPMDDATEKAAKAATADTVGGTAGTTTLMSKRRPPRHGPARWASIIAALSLLAGGVYAVTRSPNQPASPSASTTVEGAPEPPLPTPAEPAVPPPADETIELRVETTAPAAKVFRGDQELGAVPGPFALPRGSEPIELEVRAEGYQTAQLTVVPDRNRSERPTLKPLRRPAVATPRPVVTPAAPTGTAEPVSPDLETPGVFKE